jgi:3-deoxy-D-manno-octulosonic-acid transferase
MYSFLVQVLRPFAFAQVLWRGLRDRGYREGLGERFGFGSSLPAGPTLWLHAVSLGEVIAATPLVRALQIRYPHLALIVTTATPTGRARARALFGESAAVRFLPYDTPGSMRRFLRRAQPALAVIMETELWPNLFDQCRRLGIPILLANARLSPRSVRRYRLAGRLFRDLLAGDVVIAAQSAADAERFIALGAAAGRARVVGNVKFDVAVDAAATERGRLLRAREWGPRPVWIAGSTHAGEEEAALAAHVRLQASCAGALLLLVPRHPARFDAVAALLESRGVRFERRSGGHALRPDTAVILVDTVGELAALYAATDVAFVGGSLVPVGGHNLLEPAALGVPVITGPHQSNGRDVAQLMLREGAALQVADAAELAAALLRLFADPQERRRIGAAGRHAVEANRGSVGRLLELIAAQIPAVTSEAR